MTATSPPDFGILLGRSYAAFVDQLRAALADQGFDDLGILYGAVFRVLADGAVSLRELADRLDMTSAGALKIVNEMEARGYVGRIPDGDDGRVRRIELADRGEQAFHAARRLHRRFERKLATAYGAETVAAARGLMEAMVTADDASHTAPPPLRRVV